MNNKKTALITGSYGGLGTCFTNIHAEKGGNLILIGRSQEKLNEQAESVKEKFGVEVHTIEIDLSIPDAAQIIYDTCRENNWTVDYHAGGLSDTKLFANAVDPTAVAREGYEGMLDGKLNVTSGLISWQKPMMSLAPMRYDIFDDENTVTLKIAASKAELIMPTFLVESEMVFIIHIIRSATKYHISPLQIKMQRPPKTSEFSEFAGCTVESADEYVVIFSTEDFCKSC